MWKPEINFKKLWNKWTALSDNSNKYGERTELHGEYSSDLFNLLCYIEYIENKNKILQDGFDKKIDVNLYIKMKDKYKKYKREIEIMKRSLEEKNKALDAMYWVWCSGGCGGGVARNNHNKYPEEEIIKLAERNTARLRSWHESFKMEHRKERRKGDFLDKVKNIFKKFKRNKDV